MTWLRRSAWALRSLLAFAMAIATTVLVNLAGSAMATLVDAPVGGSVRLAWDMACVMVSMVLATAVLVRTAPGARRAHVIAFAVLALLFEALAVLQLGDDWPLWFSAGIVLTLSMQVAAGAWLGGLRAGGRYARAR